MAGGEAWNHYLLPAFAAIQTDGSADASKAPANPGGGEIFGVRRIRCNGALLLRAIGAAPGENVRVREVADGTEPEIVRLRTYTDLRGHGQAEEHAPESVL